MVGLEGATHKPLSMLELYRANPKPREEAMPWLRENILYLMSPDGFLLPQPFRILLLRFFSSSVHEVPALNCFVERTRVPAAGFIDSGQLLQRQKL